MDNSISDAQVVQQITHLIRKIIKDELKNIKADREFQAVVYDDPTILGFANIVPNAVVGALGDSPVIIPNVRTEPHLRLRANDEVYVRAINGNMNNLIVTTSKNILNNLLKLPFRTVSTNTNIKITDVVVYCNASNGNITLTLPDASKCSTTVMDFVRLDSTSNTVTVVGSLSQMINGVSSMQVSTTYPKRWIQSDGSNWWIIMG